MAARENIPEGSGWHGRWGEKTPLESDGHHCHQCPMGTALPAQLFPWTWGIRKPWKRENKSPSATPLKAPPTSPTQVVQPRPGEAVYRNGVNRIPWISTHLSITLMEEPRDINLLPPLFGCFRPECSHTFIFLFFSNSSVLMMAYKKIRTSLLGLKKLN